MNTLDILNSTELREIEFFKTESEVFEYIALVVKLNKNKVCKYDVSIYPNWMNSKYFRVKCVVFFVK